MNPRDGRDGNLLHELASEPAAAAAREQRVGWLGGGDAELCGFRRLDLAAFLAEDPPELDYLLGGLLEFGELCWLSGRGKVGKSMLALFLANALLDGAETFLGRPVGAVDWVLYIDGENREPTIRRRVHLCGMSAAAAAKIDYRSVRGIDLGSFEGMAGLRALVDRPGRGLVILDSLVALHTIDENQAGEVRRFADALRAIFEPSGVTTLGLAHENRGGDLRGSLDWRNSADRVLQLVKDGDGVRELRNGEIRDGPEDALPATFRFVAELDTMHRRRLVLEPSELVSQNPLRTRGQQLSELIISKHRDDPTISRANMARFTGYDPQHGTFKRAWTQASKVLAEDGANVATNRGQATESGHGANGATPLSKGGPSGHTDPDGHPMRGAA